VHDGERDLQILVNGKGIEMPADELGRVFNRFSGWIPRSIGRPAAPALIAGS
jgi:hypothetical protein